MGLHCWSPNRLVDVFVRIKTTGEVTANDRFIFFATLFDPSTSKEEFFLIDRVCYSVYRGRVRMTDDAFPYLDRKSQSPKLFSVKR